jgi:hypothetical protein
MHAHVIVHACLRLQFVFTSSKFTHTGTRCTFARTFFSQKIKILKTGVYVRIPTLITLRTSCNNSIHHPLCYPLLQSSTSCFLFHCKKYVKRLLWYLCKFATPWQGCLVRYLHTQLRHGWRLICYLVNCTMMLFPGPQGTSANCVPDKMDTYDTLQKSHLII